MKKLIVLSLALLLFPTTSMGGVTVERKREVKKEVTRTVEREAVPCRVRAMPAPCACRAKCTCRARCTCVRCPRCVPRVEVRLPRVEVKVAPRCVPRVEVKVAPRCSCRARCTCVEKCVCKRCPKCAPVRVRPIAPRRVLVATAPVLDCCGEEVENMLWARRVPLAVRMLALRAGCGCGCDPEERVDPALDPLEPEPDMTPVEDDGPQPTPADPVTRP